MKKEHVSDRRFLISKKELQDAIKDVVLPLFGSIEKKIDGLEVRIDGLEKKVNLLEKRFDKRIDSLEVSMASFYRDFCIHKNDTASNFDHLFTRIKALEDEYHVLATHTKDWSVVKRVIQQY